MNTPDFENLDFACAKQGKDIALNPSKELEKLITDALAVLEEQGVYALFLFLKISKNNESGDVSKKLHNFLRKNPKQRPLLLDKDDILTSHPEMFENLDDLLLARDLIRQTLVYARYHAKCEVEK